MSNGRTVWRPLLVSRIALAVLSLSPLVPVGLLVADVPSPFDPWWLVALLLMLCIGAGFLSIAFSYVVLDDDGIGVRNFLPRERRYPWSSVRSVGLGYNGVEIRVRERRWTTYGWAVQTSNWRAATGRPGRGALFLDEVQTHAPHVHVY